MTHEEARTLIHLLLDASLNNQQKKLLEAHLASCPQCKQYADSLRSLESILSPLLQRQWTQQPVPLPVGMVLPRHHAKTSDSMILASRIAALGVMFMIFVFSAWQFALARPGVNPVEANVPLIPVPSTSTQLVATNTQNEACEDTTYVVQQNDTLGSIALKFGVSKAQIVQANQMRSEAVRTGATLMVPLCRPTPTTETLTKTFTPVLGTITSTPGG
jgi:LysM repeat protein